MKKLWMVVAASGALVLSTNAWAQDEDMSGSTTQQQGSSGSMGGGMQHGTSGSQMGSSAQMGGGSHMAKVQKVDKDKNMVTLQLPLSPSATIRKNGQTATLDQIKEGDQVRASFDPTTNQITTLDVQPKGGSSGATGGSSGSTGGSMGGSSGSTGGSSSGGGMTR